MRVLRGTAGAMGAVPVLAFGMSEHFVESNTEQHVPLLLTVPGSFRPFGKLMVQLSPVAPDPFFCAPQVGDDAQIDTTTAHHKNAMPRLMMGRWCIVTKAIEVGLDVLLLPKFCMRRRYAERLCKSRAGLAALAFVARGRLPNLNFCIWPGADDFKSRLDV